MNNLPDMQVEYIWIGVWVVIVVSSSNPYPQCGLAGLNAYLGKCGSK